MFKVKSYKEKIERTNKIPEFDSNKEVETIEQYNDIQDGVVIPRVKSVKKRCESPKEYNVFDFKMENMQAVGADKGLKEFNPVDDLHKFEESIVDLEEKIEKFENDKND